MKENNAIKSCIVIYSSVYLHKSATSVSVSVRLVKVNMAPWVSITFLLAFSLSISTVKSESNQYAFARVESCGGCSLNRYPDVSKFIHQDVPEYENVEFKHIQGAAPNLVLFNENDEEVDRLPLSSLTRQECNDLLVAKGFSKTKASKDEF